MELKRDYHTKLQDEQKLAKIGLENPQLVLPINRPQFTPEFYEKIGIFYKPEVLGQGFIRLFWSDFIVEELTADGRVISILPDEETHLEEKNPEKPKTEADLVKQGMPTLEAIERLSEVLNIFFKDINYAGLKDAGALTSQEVSFNNLRPEKLANLQIPNLFLKNIHERKGVVEVGKLYGNRFTILVRSNKIDTNKLKDKIEQIKTRGFWNFYSLQRFGPRLQSHEVGQLILEGKYQEAVKKLLVGESPHEMPIFQNIRKSALSSWGNWAKMKEYFREFPYFLYYEIQLLTSLEETSINFVKALKDIQEQTKMNVYAYFSFLFNLLLSRKVQGEKILPELPLFRDYSEIKGLYTDFEEYTKNIKFVHPGLEFLNLSKKQFVKPIILPSIWHVFETPVGYLFHFDLGKGAYATTLLGEFFNLYQGKPMPSWVNQAEYDTRVILGYPSLNETLEKFVKPEDMGKIDLIE